MNDNITKDLDPNKVENFEKPDEIEKEQEK